MAIRAKLREWERLAIYDKEAPLFSKMIFDLSPVRGPVNHVARQEKIAILVKINGYNPW